MKKLLLIGVLLLLPFQVVSAQRLLGGGYGTLLQDGYSPEAAYSLTWNIPTFTPDSMGWRLVTTPDVLYSNREVGESQQIEAVRAMESMLMVLPWVPVELNVGSGFYLFTNTAGEDEHAVAYRLGLSYTGGGLWIYGGADVIQQDGDNIYYVGLSFSAVPF